MGRDDRPESQRARSSMRSAAPGEGEVMATTLHTETQRSISAWADDTFGDAGSHARTAARANEEMAELLATLTNDLRSNEKAIDECADIVIILFRLADRMGFDLLAEVDRKMLINRGRTWKRDGSGHGYHV